MPGRARKALASACLPSHPTGCGDGRNPHRRPARPSFSAGLSNDGRWCGRAAIADAELKAFRWTLGRRIGGDAPKRPNRQDENQFFSEFCVFYLALPSRAAISPRMIDTVHITLHLRLWRRSR
jgi:hypothetical protein